MSTELTEVTCSLPQSPPSPINFSESNLKGWEITGYHKGPSDHGSWRIVNGELFENAEGDCYRILVDDLELSDHVAQTKVKIVDPASHIVE